MIEAITPQDETVYLDPENIDENEVYMEGMQVITGETIIQRLEE